MWLIVLCGLLWVASCCLYMFDVVIRCCCWMLLAYLGWLVVGDVRWCLPMCAGVLCIVSARVVSCLVSLGFVCCSLFLVVAVCRLWGWGSVVCCVMMFEMNVSIAAAIHYCSWLLLLLMSFRVCSCVMMSVVCRCCCWFACDGLSVTLCVCCCSLLIVVLFPVCCRCVECGVCCAVCY